MYSPLYFWFVARLGVPPINATLILMTASCCCKCKRSLPSLSMYDVGREKASLKFRRCIQTPPMHDATTLADSTTPQVLVLLRVSFHNPPIRVVENQKRSQLNMPNPNTPFLPFPPPFPFPYPPAHCCIRPDCTPGKTRLSLSLPWLISCVLKPSESANTFL